jgi:RsiW-degrading membrane proteinase PrsW (M82 family)
MTRRWAWLLVLVGGVLLFEIVRRVLIETQNPNLVPSLILLGAAVAPATFVVFVLDRRLPYDISGGAIGVVAFLSGIVGVVTAGFLEYDTLRDLGVLPLVAVGFIEEAAKLIVPVVLLIGLHRYRLPSDGLLIGVAAGAGFAALETMGYAFVTLISSRGDLAAVDNVLVLRGLLSPAAHMAWSGLTATALWYAAARGWKIGAVWRFVAVFLLAVALHTTWDSVGTIPVYIVLSAISLGLLTWFAHLLAREMRVPAAVPA